MDKNENHFSLFILWFGRRQVIIQKETSIWSEMNPRTHDSARMYVPDTFASKVAAIQDATADNSVGNVTGSNAVNVFLGIGVAWSIAAIYHAYHGNVFIVPPGKWVLTSIN